MYKMGVNSKYKLFSILSGGGKASTTFSILSPVLSGGLGYAKYITYRPYEGTTVKNWSIRCIYATDSSMYNRIKLVRTGDNTFDVYYQSNTGNDYCTFILDETTQTDLEIVAAGVSSIPEDIYKESAYAPVYFGDIYGSLKGNADTAAKSTQDGNGNNIADTYLPKTGGTMSGALTVESNVFLKSSSTTRYLQIATVNNSGVAFTSRLYVDVNAGRGAFLQFINKGVAYELGVHTDGAPRYIKGDTSYMLYHAGNLVNATTSKAGLMSAEDKNKLTYIENGANNFVLQPPLNDELGGVRQGGQYVSFNPDGTIRVELAESALYANSAGTVSNVPVATSSNIGGIKSGEDIEVSENGDVSILFAAKASEADCDNNGNYITDTYLRIDDADKTYQNKTKPIPFNNSSDQINIDNYPQNDYGTITIWYNFAQADGTSPGQEGVIYQTKYKSEQGEGGSGYVDCLTQLYVGSGGIKHRTAIDYDEAAPFDGIPWS